MRESFGSIDPVGALRSGLPLALGESRVRGEATLGEMGVGQLGPHPSPLPEGEGNYRESNHGGEKRNHSQGRAARWAWKE